MEDIRTETAAVSACDAPEAAAAVQRTPEEEFLASMLARRDLSDLTDSAAQAEAEAARIEELSPEERQAYEERRALETVFEDIRLRSHGGELTTPDYWETVGLVPEHADPAVFTALAFDTIIEAQALSAERAQAEAVPAADAPDAAAPDAADETPGVGAQAARFAESDGPALSEAAPSADAGVVSDVPEAAEGEPEPEPWELDDIRVLEGSQVYLYSADHMTDSFAQWAFQAAENDDVVTLVENARTESKVYPRPLKAASLKNRPLYLTDERIEAAFATAQESGLYPDIRTCAASNGDVYFYSTEYLSDAQAKALAEWESVERRANM